MSACFALRLTTVKFAWLLHQTFADALLECIYRGEAHVATTHDAQATSSSNAAAIASKSSDNAVTSSSSSVDGNKQTSTSTPTTSTPTPVATSYWSRLTSYFVASQYADTDTSTSNVVNESTTTTTTTATTATTATSSTTDDSVALPGSWPSASLQDDDADVLKRAAEREALTASINELAPANDVRKN